MALSSLVSLVLVSIIAFFSSASHVGICVGPAVGTGLLRRNLALALYVSMVLLGAFTQGVAMSKAVFNPSICSLTTTTAVAVVPSILGIPLSLNFALYTSQIGCSLGLGIERLAYASMCWIALLTLTAMLSTATMSFSRAWASGTGSILKALRKCSTLLFILTTAMCFVVGANTFGFIIQFVRGSLLGQLLAIASMVLGSITLYRKSLERVAYRFYRIGVLHAITCYAVSVVVVEVATLLSLPLPASLTVVTALYFSGFIAPFRMISCKSYVSYVAVQIVSIPIALSIGFALSAIN